MENQQIIIRKITTLSTSIEKIESEKEEETYRTEVLQSTLIERESTLN